MKTPVLFFGQLADITGCESIDIMDEDNTDALLRKLEDMYPALTGSKFIIAVDKETITGNRILKDGNTVALLPPFSGG